MSNILKPEISCKTAKEFLDTVLPSNNHFGERIEEPTWLFRGQGRDYPLIPSLFRTDKTSMAKLQSLVFKKISDSYEERLSIEAFLIRNFFILSDKRGLLLPEDSQEIRSTLAMLESNNFFVINDNGKVVVDKLLSLVGLAQHYSTPTRLIDWSLQPLIAAFFAAEGGVRRFNPEKKEFSDPNIPIVFWAFYFPSFQFSGSIQKKHYSVKGVTAPSAGNPNLRAQQGVFTIVNHEFTSEKENNYLPLENILQNLETSPYSKDVEGCEMQKITLPVSESINLIRILSKFDITPSSIYPGYHSIISDIQMNNIKDINDLE